VLDRRARDAAFFEEVAKGRDGSRGELGHQRVVRPPEQGRQDDRKTPISAKQLGGIVDLIGGRHHLRQDRQGSLRDRLHGRRRSRDIVEKRGMKQVTDTGAIEKVVDEIIAANPDKVEQAKAKPTLLGWFVGQVMKASGGKANPQRGERHLEEKARHLKKRPGVSRPFCFMAVMHLPIPSPGGFVRSLSRVRSTGLCAKRVLRGIESPMSKITFYAHSRSGPSYRVGLALALMQSRSRLNWSICRVAAPVRRNT
jgi:hypothetical protein